MGYLKHQSSDTSEESTRKTDLLLGGAASRWWDGGRSGGASPCGLGLGGGGPRITSVIDHATSTRKQSTYQVVVLEAGYHGVVVAWAAEVQVEVSVPQPVVSVAVPQPVVSDAHPVVSDAQPVVSEAQPVVSVPQAPVEVQSPGVVVSKSADDAVKVSATYREGPIARLRRRLLRGRWRRSSF